MFCSAGRPMHAQRQDGAAAGFALVDVARDQPVWITLPTEAFTCSCLLSFLAILPGQLLQTVGMLPNSYVTVRHIEGTKVRLTVYVEFVQGTCSDAWHVCLWYLVTCTVCHCKLQMQQTLQTSTRTLFSGWVRGSCLCCEVVTHCIVLSASFAGPAIACGRHRNSTQCVSLCKHEPKPCASVWTLRLVPDHLAYGTDSAATGSGLCS